MQAVLKYSFILFHPLLPPFLPPLKPAVFSDEFGHFNRLYGIGTSFPRRFFCGIILFMKLWE
jgi:hypothetical protein